MSPAHNVEAGRHHFSGVGRLHREPLLQFFVIGAVLFVAAHGIAKRLLGSDLSNHMKIFDKHLSSAAPGRLEGRFRGRNGSLKEGGPCPAPIGIIFRTTSGTSRTAATASSSC